MLRCNITGKCAVGLSWDNGEALKCQAGYDRMDINPGLFLISGVGTCEMESLSMQIPLFGNMVTWYWQGNGGFGLLNLKHAMPVQTS